MTKRKHNVQPHAVPVTQEPYAFFKKRYKVLLVALLCLAGFLVYGNTISNEFVWDDLTLIVNNHDIKELNIKNITTLLTHDLLYFSERTNFYRPLQSLSYLAEYALWDSNSFGFHLTNIIIHISSGLMIFFLLRRLSQDLFSSFFASLFFIVHPVNTSAVGYISGRADLLGLFFLLVASFYIFRWRETKAVVDATLCLIAFVAGLLSKEACVMFPFFAGFYLLRECAGSDRRDKMLCSLLFVVMAVYLAMRLTVLKFIPLMAQAQASHAPSLWIRLLALGPILITYLRLIVLPYDLRMERNLLVPSGLGDAQVLVSFALLAVIAFIAMRYLWKERIARLGIVWFFVFLFPSLNIIIPINASISEHWLYIPFFGIALVMSYCGGVVSALLRRQGVSLYLKHAVLAICCAAVLIYGALTIHENTYWKDTKTLFEHICTFKDIHPRAYRILGFEYTTAGEYKKALELFTKDFGYEPDNPNALLGMAISNAGLNNLEISLDYFRKAVKEDPYFYNGYISFAENLGKMKKFDEAIPICKEGIALETNNPLGYICLGKLYAGKGLFDEAEAVWRKGLELRYDKQTVDRRMQKLVQETRIKNYLDEAKAQAQDGRYGESIALYTAALRVDPNNVEAHNNLGIVYGLTGKNDDAAAEFKKTLELKPDSYDTCKNIGIIYSRDPGRYKEAVHYLKQYLKFKPDDNESEKIKNKILEIERGLEAR